MNAEDFAALDILIEDGFPEFLLQSFAAQNQSLALPKRLYPHVTITWPFMCREEANGSVLATLERLLRSTASFAFSLTRTEVFQNDAGESTAFVLLAEPADRFANLSEKVLEAFPAIKPERWPSRPHCTIVSSDCPARLRQTAEELDRRLRHTLPLRYRAKTVNLTVCGCNGWESEQVFMLGPQKTALDSSS